MKILIVDDSLSIIEVLVQVLDGPSNEISFAYDGSQAHSRVTTKDFDLIISDIKMPIIGGIEFGLKLRELNQGVPIIFFSAELSGQEIYEQSLKRIGKAYFVENKDFIELIQIVRELERTHNCT